MARLKNLKFNELIKITIFCSKATDGKFGQIESFKKLVWNRTIKIKVFDKGPLVSY